MIMKAARSAYTKTHHHRSSSSSSSSTSYESGGSSSRSVDRPRKKSLEEEKPFVSKFKWQELVAQYDATKNV